MNKIKNVIQSEAKNLECVKSVFSRSFTTLRSVLDDNITLAILFLFIPFFSSCEHRELSDPNTGHYLRVYLDEEIKNVTCGFYDEAGEFSYLVGLPGKSGVGGGIIAVYPHRYSVAVWSPRLNSKGNSVMGMKALELLTTYTEESIF